MIARRVVSVVALVALCVAGSPVRADGGRVTINVRDASLADVVSLVSLQGGMNVILDGSVPAVTVPSFTLVNVSVGTALAAIEGAYGLHEVSIGDPHNGGYLRLLPTASTIGGAGYTGDDLETIVVPMSGASSQAYGALMQQAVRFVSVVPSPTGRGLIVTGSRASVERARPIIAAILGVPPTFDGLPDLVALGVENGTPTDIRSRLDSAGLIEPSTIVVADDSRNRLLVRGSDRQLAALKDALKIVDVPTPQVTFECQIIDVQPTSSSNAGFTWGGTNSAGSVTVGTTFTSFAGKGLPVNLTINALVEQGFAKIVARPNVSAMNGHKGAILVGEQYPIATTNGSLVGGQTVQFVPIGVQMSFTPIIGSDGTIHVDMTTTYSELKGTDPTSGYPIIGQATVQSYISVRDGEPIYIAGLFQDMTSSTVSKVPLLGDIPILGEIFKSRQKSSQHDEIVFAIYPHLGLSSTPMTAPLQFQSAPAKPVGNG